MIFPAFLSKSTRSLPRRRCKLALSDTRENLPTSHAVKAMEPADSDSVTADINYTVDTGEKLVNETFGPGNIRRRSTGSYESRPVTITNARPLASELSLDVQGFVLVRHASAVSDFLDAVQLKAV